MENLFYTISKKESDTKQCDFCLGPLIECDNGRLACVNRCHIINARARLNIIQISNIVKLRGLGFSQKEIGDKIGNVTQEAISYQLKRIKKLALKEGINEVFQYYLSWMK